MYSTKMCRSLCFGVLAQCLKMNCRGLLVSHKRLLMNWSQMEETGILWALGLCIWLKRAGFWIFELERLFCKSQIFLKYFAEWLFEMARNLLPNDLHVAARGSGMPIFLKRANKSWQESRSCTWGIVESWANDMHYKAQMFTSLDEVPFDC